MKERNLKRKDLIKMRKELIKVLNEDTEESEIIDVLKRFLDLKRTM
jgi:hypothetical protein